jgi:hypothetical protein
MAVNPARKGNSIYLAKGPMEPKRQLLIPASFGCVTVAPGIAKVRRRAETPPCEIRPVPIAVRLSILDHRISRLLLLERVWPDRSHLGRHSHLRRDVEPWVERDSARVCHGPLCRRAGAHFPVFLFPVERVAEGKTALVFGNGIGAGQHGPRSLSVQQPDGHLARGQRPES